MSAEMRPDYQVQFIGNLRVEVDYAARAVSVSVVGEEAHVRTDDLGNGFLVDRNSAGQVVAVEIIGAQP